MNTTNQTIFIKDQTNNALVTYKEYLKIKDIDNKTSINKKVNQFLNTIFTTNFKDNNGVLNSSITIKATNDQYNAFLNIYKHLVKNNEILNHIKNNANVLKCKKMLATALHANFKLRYIKINKKDVNNWQNTEILFDGKNWQFIKDFTLQVLKDMQA